MVLELWSLDYCVFCWIRISMRAVFLDLFSKNSMDWSELLIGLAGFEPARHGLEDRYSIQLSYRPDIFLL